MQNRKAITFRSQRSHLQKSSKMCIIKALFLLQNMSYQIIQNTKAVKESFEEKIKRTKGRKDHLWIDILLLKFLNLYLMFLKPLSLIMYIKALSIISEVKQKDML